MDDVAGGNQDAYAFSHGHDHRLIDFEQVMLALGLQIVNLGKRRLEIADEAESIIDVVVAPLPLVAGDLDGHVRHGRVLHRQNRLGRGKRHEQQNEKRDDGPDDLDHRVLVKLRRLMALGLAVGEDRIEHHREDADEDHDADPHDVNVEIEYLLADRRDRRLQVVFLGRVRDAGAQHRREHCGRRYRLRNKSDGSSHLPTRSAALKQSMLSPKTSSMRKKSTRRRVPRYRALPADKARRKSRAIAARSCTGSSSASSSDSPRCRNTSRTPRLRGSASTSSRAQNLLNSRRVRTPPRARSTTIRSPLTVTRSQSCACRSTQPNAQHSTPISITEYGSTGHAPKAVKVNAIANETAHSPPKSTQRAREPIESLRRETAQKSDRTGNDRSISTDIGN